MTPSPAGRQDLLRNSVAAISLANLCLLEVWRQLFSAPEDQYYFARSHGLIDYAGALIAVGCLGLFFLGLLLAAQKLRPRSLWQLLFATFTLAPLNILRINSSFSWVRIKDSVTPLALALGLVAAAFLATFVWRKRRHFFSFLITTLLVLSPFALVTASRSLVGAWASRQPRASVVTPTQVPAPARDLLRAKTPVVVLLFDELDDRFINPSTRPPDLDLPELDRLRDQSTVFEDATRPGPETLVAIPSLTIGAVVDAATPRGPSELLVTQGGEALRWGDQPNVFDVAVQSGFDVHIVGWYQPYCRIFTTVSSCSWIPHSEYFVGRHENLFGTVLEYMNSLSPFSRRRLAVRTYEQILVEAKEQVGSSSGLAWIHFPIPHAPFIYDRTAGVTTPWRGADLKGYLDNVALVDQTIGQLRVELGRAWDDTAIVIVSDHEWRQSGAFDGKTDDRVPLYIKLPGSSSGQVVTSEIPAHILPYVLLALLRGEISSDEELLVFVAEGVNEPLR